MSVFTHMVLFEISHAYGIGQAEHRIFVIWDKGITHENLTHTSDIQPNMQLVFISSSNPGDTPWIETQTDVILTTTLRS